MTPIRTASLAALAVFLLPLATHAAWWMTRDHPRAWHEANWTSAGLLPPPHEISGAVLYVMAGRTGRWKGIFAHHSWLVVKREGQSRYRRYEVVGWGVPVRVDAYAADARWYSHRPEILLTLQGAVAATAIDAAERAIASYPHRQRGSYGVWPGPNSNTFVAHVARAVPELAAALLPTAIGKDYFDGKPFFGVTPSRTGLQVSLGGLGGLAIGWIEGIEANVLGLVAGLDIRRPALKLPGWGRIGLPAQ